MITKASILIAQDEAFNFIYRANIDALARQGEITFFSPLHDIELPPCSILYLPGGYPELFAAKLSANLSMRQSVKDYAEQGGRIFAECGGFMYLCSQIDNHAMCSVLPHIATMQNAHLHLGYRQMTFKKEQWHGHEFHYSSIAYEGIQPGMEILRIQQSAAGIPVNTPLYLYKNVVAGYTHWYWGHRENLKLLL